MPNDRIAEAQRAVLASQVAAPGETSLGDVARRVASAVSDAEPSDGREEWAERFADLIAEGSFLPSVPILANAGLGGQLAACFALEVADSLDSIYGTLHRAARIQQGSGGVGIEFSALRPRGTAIGRSGGHTPGPIAFAELFAHSARVMSMAGRRAGAHLAILRDDHPDIVEFVRAKRNAPERFPQLGLAVGISDRLLQAAQESRPWTLHHPRGVSGWIPARDLLCEIAQSILETGDPTLLFLDRIDADNPTPALGRLRATNPCGEQPLLSEESCVLGSLRLPSYLSPHGELDEPRLARSVRAAVRFLDDALEVNAWPDDRLGVASQRTRKVGLGVMGLADALLLAELPYASAEARSFAHQAIGIVAREADAASAALGEERGIYPAWERGRKQRNASTRALAPTGTLSLLAGCSPGIEPFISPRLSLLTARGDVPWTDAPLARWLERRTPALQAVLDALASGRSCDALPDLSSDDRNLLRRAWEIEPEDQLAMQAEVQRCVDGAVSKTVHLDCANAPDPAQVVDWIQLARSLGCKGIALYQHDEASRPPRIDLRAACPASCLP